MKISIVSPSYNQANYIEKTLSSVASQSYENKEHIVVDSCSTDGCVAIIECFKNNHSHLKAIVELDRGQADAINKGLCAATGDILAWINTDDVYSHPEVFSNVMREFQDNPLADVIYGRGTRLDANGSVIKEAFVNRNIENAASLKRSLGIFQPAVFFRRRVFDVVGGLSEDYDLQLDYEYWIRILQAGFKFHFMNEHLAAATVHEDAKSTRDRLRQLSECISMIGDKYGQVPDDWIKRFSDFYATRRDEKVHRVNLTKNEKEISDLVFATQKSALQIQSDPPSESISSNAGEKTFSRNSRKIVVTSFDKKYFQQGLNLIASLHRTSFFSFDEIHVYPLDLSEGQKEFLSDLAKVRVIEYPDASLEDFPDFYEPSTRAYKVAAIAGKGTPLESGSLVLWMDAGLTCCSDIDEVFRHITDKGFFITNHDDSLSWPFYNINFIHRGAVDAINPSNDELLAPHLCSCIIGYERGGRFQALIDDAYRIGSKRAAVVWPKVITGEVERKYNANKGGNSAGLRKFKARKKLQSASFDDLYSVFPYYGHRTQSIYSVLAHRMGAPVFSAKLFHKANESSKKAASDNWVQGADVTNARSSRSELDAIDETTRIYQHRGVYTNLSGLILERAVEPVVIVANGPSLTDFDFEQLRGRAWLGMNAAYRYWEQNGIYPYIYVCFDTVVQNSHKEEIKKLILHRRENGIRWFFLRRDFVDYFSEAENLGCIFFLEDLQKSVEWFDRGKITTGSFSLYVCCFLGFTEIYIMGVDLNYVERIPEAKAEGQELVITSEISKNPNYFFEGYQRPGDRFNPPNRHPDMHLRSWNEAAEVLKEFPISVFNCNPRSAVTAFPFVRRERTMKDLNSRHLHALRIADRMVFFRARQIYWRRFLLERIGRPNTFDFHPDQGQINRFSRWIENRPYSDGQKMDNRRDSRTIRLDSPKRGAESSPALDTGPTNPWPEIRGIPREANVRVDESEVVSYLLQARTGRSHIMLDVGAHFGTSASYFDALGWKIHCFEPDPKNRKKLEKRFGKRDNLTIDSRAVSDAPARGVPFFQSDESTGISGLHAFRDTHREIGTVDVTTVAEVVNELALDHVDFLKVDVEGFDFSVLKGVPWDRLQPDVIECEFEDFKTVPLGHTWKDMAQYLQEKGYAVYLSEWYPIIRYGIRHDWRRIVGFPGAEIAPDAWGNILAFRQDPGFEAVARAFDEIIVGKNMNEAADSVMGQHPSGTQHRMAMSTSGSRYERFVRWSLSRNPIIYRVGQFVMWCLRTARRQKPAAAALVILPAVLAASGFMSSDPLLSILSWGAAAIVVMAAVLVAVIGFTGHLVQRASDETQLRFTAQERKLRNLENQAKSEKALRESQERKLRSLESQTKSEKALRESLAAGIQARLSVSEKILNDANEKSLRFEEDTNEKLLMLPAAQSRANEGIAKVEKLAKSASVFNMARFQSFNRTLETHHVSTFISDWAKPLGLELNEKRLGYLAHRACMLESRMKGRLATSVEAIVLRSLVASAVKQDGVSILEIGTLFGVGAAAVYESAANEFDAVHITVIDPLDGYYAAGNRDLLTGVKVSEATLRQNWSLAPIPEGDFTIIEHLSSDPEAIEAAAKRRYDVLIIDGDHSYDGVKFDFDTYCGMMRPGGYILFDDYDVQDWPDIKRYVDTEIEGLPHLHRVGAAFRTAVYQVRENETPATSAT